MDNISTANDLIWIVVLIMALCVFPIVFTFLIWSNNKKIFLVSYIVNTLLMGIVFFINLQAFFFSSTYEGNLVTFLPIGKIFTILGIILLIGSIILRFKNNILCKILNTISMIIGLIVLICYLKII